MKKVQRICTEKKPGKIPTLGVVRKSVGIRDFLSSNCALFALA